MAPVFFHAAWQCVWHLIQLAHEKSSVVDSQWIVHQVIPFLGRPSRVHADAVEIGTFRTYPEGYKPLDEPVSEYQTIPLNKIEDFGVHCKQVSSLDLSPC
ncbi:COP9 signalosome complex subunit 5b-like [Cucumis melo var. makuwa]|uniref:COP9 signalosome complex subunit 5b-like n=1 Tax=Cucumis melo var. makuwa TaxID=1194695 RepID=A0A5A7TQC9_CUCMM|nr:COP9 signalosome complex subunit 5b-like [Cucumis melo var. makuwa]